MDKVWKERWVKALRSGEYKQGRAALRTADDKFCCLGVLCDLAAKDGRMKWVPSGSCYGANRATFTGVLPPAVCKLAGLRQRDPVVGDDNTLTAANDCERLSFLEIADLIEKHL